MKLLLISFLLLLIPQSGFAYQIRSPFGDPCHEKMALEAFTESGVIFAAEDFKLPKNTNWKNISKDILNGLVIEDERRRFLVVSLLIGVRSPDSDGHALLDLDVRRPLHTADESQYLHSLRSKNDDGPKGDETAVAGIREQILMSVESAVQSEKKPIIEVEEAVEYYGLIPIEVSAKAYYFGRALHTVQDSFSHSIRSDDTRRIHHIMNYVEIVLTELDEARDGIPHSENMDACDEQTAPLRKSALEASIQLLIAGSEVDPESRAAALQKMLDDWMTYEAGCNFDNGYCDSEWVAISRERITGPSSCSVIQHPSALWPILLIGFLFRPRRRREN